MTSFLFVLAGRGIQWCSSFAIGSIKLRLVVFGVLMRMRSVA